MTDMKYVAYEKAVRQVWLDGMVSIDEADMIEALRKSLNITLEEHAEIEKKIRKELDLDKADEEKEPETPPGAPPPVPTDSPPSGLSEPADESEPKEEPASPIGEMSSDDLAKDLDILSKSIDKLGERLGKGDSVAKPEPETEPEPNASSKMESLSERMEKDQAETISKDAVSSEEGKSGSDFLEKLKLQYEHEKDEPTEESPLPGLDKQMDTVSEEADISELKKEETPEPEIEEAKAETKIDEPEPKTLEDEGEEEELVTTDDFLKAGKDAFRNQNFAKAVSNYKSALEIDPDNKEVKFFLKKAVTALKESQEAPAEPPSEPTGEKPAKKKKKKKKKKVKPKSAEAEDADLDDWSALAEDKPVKEETIIDEVPSDASTEISDKAVESDTADQEPPSTEMKGDGSCSSCGGSGTCNWCKGAMECYWCNGTGKCTKCQGEKTVDGKPCEFCNSEGTCGSCEGTGKCTWCKGSGKCNYCN